MIDITKAAFGALLHDIGKVIQRAGGESGSHSKIGANYLKRVGINDADVIDCVLYHHAAEIRAAAEDVGPYAYITYIADNIASSERRKTDGEYTESGFDPKTPLQSVFGLLSTNAETGLNERHFYRPITLDEREDINFPQKDAPEFKDFSYKKIADRLTENLSGFELSRAYINSLLELIEATLSFVPSSTDKSQTADLSLYDHLKLTCAVAGCIAGYIADKECDYRQELFINAETFYGKEFALLYSADISGIQNFIYTIHSDGALKSLRARSFYLELFMENLIDEILDETGLTRANLLYSGGGHFYMLLPNTESVNSKCSAVISRANMWLLKRFRAALFVADGFAPCSSDSLQNEPKGAYEAIFSKASHTISTKKTHRYSYEEITRLNSAHTEGAECRICKAQGDLTQENTCEQCAAFISMSGDILKQYDKNEEDTFFTVIKNYAAKSVPISETLFVKTEKRRALTEKLKNGVSGEIVRFYGKNTFDMGKNLSTKLWVGDYCKEKEVSKYADEAEGIDRIGVLRMDVDNLGSAFTSGFTHNEGKYNTISRTASLSRHLSMFFKRGINALLRDSNKKITIIYSGGDDMFLLGAWNDIIDASLEINNAFSKYTQGKLTLSAGVGLYSEKYPVHIMARETGELEDYAKNSGKNAIALFSPELCFGWDEFEKQVIGEKLKTLKGYFDSAEKEKGNAFLYQILSYLQGVEDEEKDKKAKISLARYAYLLSRAQPKTKDADKRLEFNRFAERLYDYLQSACGRKQLKAAIFLYIYSKREAKRDGSN